MNRLPIDELSAVLARLDVPLGVPEAQGLACGLLCSRPASNAKSRWFSELLDAAALVPEALAERARDLHVLDAWFGAELAALNDSELDFALALPDDERPLDDRVGALGEFCAGFVYGVGIGVAARGNPTLPADTRELLEDFMAIDGADVRTHGGPGGGSGGGAGDGPDDAKGVGPDAGPDVGSDDGSGDEEAFVELAEYVRVGVLLVNEELKPVTASARSDAGGARRRDVPAEAPAPGGPLDGSSGNTIH